MLNNLCSDNFDEDLECFINWPQNLLFHYWSIITPLVMTLKLIIFVDTLYTLYDVSDPQ